MEKENKIIPGKKVTYPSSSDTGVKAVSLGEVIQRMDPEQQVEVLDALGGAVAELLDEVNAGPELEEVIEGMESIHQDEISLVDEEERAALKHLAERRAEARKPGIDEEAFVRTSSGHRVHVGGSTCFRLGQLILNDIYRAAAQRNNSTDPRFRQKGKGKTGYLICTPNHRHRIRRGRKR